MAPPGCGGASSVNRTALQNFFVGRIARAGMEAVDVQVALYVGVAVVIVALSVFVKFTGMAGK